MSRIGYKALIKFCQERGARLLPSTEVLEIQTDDTNNITCLQTGGGPVESEQVIFCGGAWTEQILQGVATLPMTPGRGQMILCKLPEQIFEPILDPVWSQFGPNFIFGTCWRLVT